MKQRKTWPLFLIALPAAVAVWSGWVGLGELCGFGVIHPLPGIWDALKLNTAITLPIGVEAYGGYALGIWADVTTPKRVRKFAFRSAIGSLLLGLLGQVVFHLLAAAGYSRAPWTVVVFVSCIPVAALGFGMGLHQLLIHTEADEGPVGEAEIVPAQSRTELFDQLRGTITPGIAPAPAPVPQPAPEPVHHEPPPPEPVPADPPEPDIAAEADALFGPEPAPVPAAPRPPARTPARTAAKPSAPKAGRPTRAELLAQRTAGLPVPREVTGTWTPEAAGLSAGDIARIIEALPRNDLAEFLTVSRGAASRIRDTYGQPALAGAGR